MNICGEKVTHVVNVIGKKRMICVCDKHLILTENVVATYNALFDTSYSLHVGRYDGEPRTCQLMRKNEMDV